MHIPFLKFSRIKSKRCGARSGSLTQNTPLEIADELLWRRATRCVPELGSIFPAAGRQWGLCAAEVMRHPIEKYVQELYFAEGLSVV